MQQILNSWSTTYMPESAQDARNSAHGFLLSQDPLVSYCPHKSQERCPYTHQSKYEVIFHFILLELSGKLLVGHYIPLKDIEVFNLQYLSIRPYWKQGF